MNSADVVAPGSAQTLYDKIKHRAVGALIRVARARLKKRLAGAIRPTTAVISSNCIGGRLSSLAGVPYRSPTVGLWFWPDEFIIFVSDLAAHLKMDISEDSAGSEHHGYPVGRLGDHVRLMFQHYPTFEAGAAAWKRRAARVDPTDIIVTFTDRDGASRDDLAAFDALPLRKIAFTATYEAADSVIVPAHREDGCVGDLYTHYERLLPVMTRQRIRKLFSTTG